MVWLARVGTVDRSLIGVADATPGPVRIATAAVIMICACQSRAKLRITWNRRRKRRYKMPINLQYARIHFGW